MTVRRTRTYSLYRQTKTKTLTITTAFILAVSSLSGALPLLFSRGALAAATTVVTPSSPAGWTAVDDNGHGGSLSYVGGPAGSLGSGSAQLSVNASDQGYMLYKAAYGGTKLSDLTTLAYDTYVQQGNNTIAPALQFNVDKDVTDLDTPWQGRLVYEPYMNGTVQDGHWQTWDAAAGKWWFSKANLFDNNCPQGAPCTISQLLALYPNLGVNNGLLAGVGFKAGSGWNTPFVGNVDNFKISTDVYDFEPDPLAAPTLLAPSNGATVTGASVTNSWSAVTGATSYEYQSFNDPAGAHLRFDGTFAATSKTATNVADGTVFYWRVRAIGAGGLTSPWSNSGNLWKVTIDSTKPAVPALLTPANNGYKTTNDFYFTWSDSSDSGSPVVYEFQSDSSGSFSSPWDSITNGNSEQNHLTSPQIHSTGAPNGSYYWRVRAIDAAGNTSDWSSTWKMTIDSNAPATPVPNYPANGVYRRSADTNYSQWSVVTDPNGPVTYYYESAFDAGFTNIAYPAHALSTNSILNPGEPEGTYYWHVKACDAAGNCSPWSAPQTIHIDNTAPVVNITAPADGATVRGSVTVSGSVTDANPDHYYFVVKDVHGAVVAGPATVNQATVASWSWNTASLPDGAYTIDLEARDKADNKDAGSVKTISVTVDNTAPVVAINGYGQSGNVIQPHATVTDTDPDLTYVWTPVNAGVTVSSTSALNPTFTVTADGTYSFQLTVTDTAGNSASVPFTFTYTTPPAEPTPPVTPAFTAVTTTTGTPAAPAPLADDTTGTTQPQVLGASTDKSSDVKGASTIKVENAATVATKKNDFLGLGWWWAAILAAVVVLWLAVSLRRSKR